MKVYTTYYNNLPVIARYFNDLILCKNGCESMPSYILYCTTENKMIHSSNFSTIKHCFIEKVYEISGADEPEELLFNALEEAFTFI